MAESNTKSNTQNNSQTDLAQIIGTMREDTSDEDKALIEKAYAFAKDAHKDHTRFSGEPYFTHLAATAKGLADLGAGARTIAAGLLHDSVEDVGIKLETIEKEFGKEIAFLVDGVTKLGQLKYRGTERHQESLRKLLVATSRDVRVLIIKLMDRLHNMQTLEFVPESKRQRIAMETLEIYAPIAHRLGMSVVRRELEDLAFKWAYPEVYESTNQYLIDEETATQQRLGGMEAALRSAFEKNKIENFEIDYRVKGLYSLWRKLQRKGDIANVHDIAALRIIVRDVADCYLALGLIHELWQPLPGKIKDYIAFPKPNGYRSLHSTVFAGDGGIVEVQIRTKEMHHEAQYGIASHVYYKEPRHLHETPDGRRASSFDWIKSLIPRLPYVPYLIGKNEKESDEAAPRGRSLAREARPRGAKRRGNIPLGATRSIAPLNDQSGGPTKARHVAPGVPDWMSELSEHDDHDFEFGIKRDFFSHRVFVFTPKGDVVDLPARSSPIDFAYAIHTDIGDHVHGVKINGKLMPLNTELHNGDIVEIDVKKSAHPSQKWLDFTKTTFARRQIRNTLEKMGQ